MKHEKKLDLLLSLYTEYDSQNHSMCVRVYNDSPHALTDFKLCFSLNVPIDAHALTHATLITQSGSYLELASPTASLKPYSSWRFVISKLEITCFHANDAPAQPFVVTSEHKIIAVQSHSPRCLYNTQYMDTLCSAQRCTEVAAQDSNTEEKNKETSFLPLIPYPLSIRALSGYHTSKKYYVSNAISKELQSKINTLHEYTKDFGLDPCIDIHRRSSPHHNPPEDCLPIEILTTDDSTHEEAYSLTILHDKIVVKVRNALGLQHAYMTLLQLRARNTRVPCVSIYDEPRFAWRGMMLDTVRQYYTPKEIKRIIRFLAFHKMNVFHWHITDDEAWRVELDAFPQLTEDYAYRGYFQKHCPYFGSGPHKSGGVYRTQDIKDIVAYAHALGIETVPEFDVPGHSLALINGIDALREKEDTSTYMSVQGYRNNVLNPGLECTYAVVNTIIKEMCEVFTGKYFHFGCDEIAEHAWTGSPACKMVMQQHNLQGISQLQSFFVQKIIHSIQQHGKTSASWEEAATHGDIDTTNIVFSWKGVREGIRATDRGYTVVMCPGQFYYLDMAQSPYSDDVGGSWAGVSHVYDTYMFEPVPSDMRHGERVIGVQANLWSENLWMKSRVDYMIFPRLAAVAETAWTPQKNKDYSRFISIAKNSYCALLHSIGVGCHAL